MKSRKNTFIALAGAALMMTAVSCSTKQFLVTSSGENLTVLTKITESESNIALEANGGYDYKGLLLLLKQKNGGYSNIYKRDNPLSPSMTQITSGNNYNDAPVMCVAANRIAYKKASPGTSADIYMMAATNSNAMIPVTETATYNEWEPSFSKDGRYIAYQRTPGTWNHIDSEIWLKNLQTGENMMLGLGLSPMLSPDGTKIVYFKYENSNACHIWVMNIDGSGSQQLTGSKNEYAQKPCWSQDGKYIIFQCRTEQKKDFDLYVMNADGTNLRQLTNNECYDGCPYWAPDNMIYFTSDRGGDKGGYQIWRFNYRP